MSLSSILSVSQDTQILYLYYCNCFMTIVTIETQTDGIITQKSDIQFTRGSLLFPYISTGFMLEKDIG